MEKQNKDEIEYVLKTTDIDWDTVVKVSTAHYVFPVLYCNLQRSNFLHYLPEELVSYMEFITNLNRERNEKIISQAYELNRLLLANKITPIFLKGTANLLAGIYDDIAERMVGDIDFIFSQTEYPKAIEILTTNSYSKVHKTTYDYPQFKHYPRLQKEHRIAAVEIHKELLIEKFAHEFNYDIIKNDCQIINNVKVMSFNHQLSLSIIAKQINDDGLYFKNIALRNAYDVFLLSKKTDAKIAFNQFTDLKNPLTNFLATCFEVFNKVDCLKYVETIESKDYLKTFYTDIENDSFKKKKHIKISRTLFLKKRLNIIHKSIFDKEHRKWLLKRITDKSWHKEKLVQLGLKKPKPNA
jgi:hypothetical protein